MSSLCHTFDTVVEMDGHKVQKVNPIYSQTSNSDITYGGLRIFTNQFSKCIVVNGSGDSRELNLDGLLQKSRTSKSFNTLIVRKPPKVPLKDVPFKPILVAITPENKLVQYDTTTGEKGAEIDMGPLKFKHLEFTKDEGLHIYMETLSWMDKASKSDITRFAFFRLFPLKKIAVFDMSRKVLGDDVRGASVLHRFLNVERGSLATGHIDMYAIHDILETGRKIRPISNDPYEPNFEVDLNRCPVVFQLKLSEAKFFDVGGKPERVIYCPDLSIQPAVHKVISLKTREAIGECVMFQDEEILNEMDDRIIEMHRDYVSIRQVMTGPDGKLSLTEVFRYPTEDKSKSENSSIRSNPTRAAAPKTFVENDRKMISVYYNTDTKMLGILGLNQESKSGREGKFAMVDPMALCLKYELLVNETLEDEGTFLELEQKYFAIKKEESNGRRKLIIYRLPHDKS